MKKKKHGGKRTGSGRPTIEDKKVTVILYIYQSEIDAVGGVDEIKQIALSAINFQVNIKPHHDRIYEMEKPDENDLLELMRKEEEKGLDEINKRLLTAMTSYPPGVGKAIDAAKIEELYVDGYECLANCKPPFDERAQYHSRLYEILQELRDIAALYQKMYDRTQAIIKEGEASWARFYTENAANSGFQWNGKSMKVTGKEDLWKEAEAKAITYAHGEWRQARRAGSGNRMEWIFKYLKKKFTITRK